MREPEKDRSKQGDFLAFWRRVWRRLTPLARRASTHNVSVLPNEVLLYTRAGCHLCDDAKAILMEHGLDPHEIDIDRDPALRARYTDVVPVVVIDGKERFRGRIDRLLLRRLLTQG